MKEEDKKTPEPERKAPKKFALGQLVYHNSFVLACSFITALVSWFIMSDGSDANYWIDDVPINIVLSPEAEADGLRVFNSSYSTVDIEVSGNTLITSKLTASDFEATATLNPASTKLTGNTMQKMTAQVRVAKVSSTSDYEIVARKPEEVNLEYDRFREVTLPIESEIDFTADNGYYPGTPVLSEQQVAVSGPESAVSKAARAVVSYKMGSPLRASEELTCQVRLYDQDGQELSGTAAQYLTMDVDAVQVTLPVMPKKTVPLRVTTAHQPSGFSEASRISVEPAQIDIAGSQEALDAVSEIRLDTVIDFAELDLNARTPSFTMEIPLPVGTRNISNTGTNTVTQATVTVNLNGYRTATVTVPEANVQLLNAPAGLDAELTTRTLDVVLAGPDAQVSKLTGDSVTVQVDMSNVDGRTGSVDAPATVTVTGTAGENCWVLGSYTLTVTLREPGALATQAPRISSIAASPEE